MSEPMEQCVFCDLEIEKRRGYESYPLDLATPKNMLQLIRYVKVLEKAVDNSSSPFTNAQQLITEAERELYPEAQP